MRFYKQIPNGSMTSDDWHTWPASSSASTEATRAEDREGKGADLGADSAHFGRRPSGSRQDSEDIEQQPPRSPPDELCSARSEDSSERMGVRGNDSSYSTFNWEVGKVAFITVFLVLAGLSNWAVLAYTHDFVGREPLPDIIFKLVPEITVAAKFGDILVSVCLICLALLLIFHQRRATIIRRVFFIAATLYSMRSVTLLATQLPPGYADNERRCRKRENFTLTEFLGRWGEQTVRFGFQNAEGMLCGDMLFSGHTLVMMVCLLTVSHYLPDKYKLFRVFPYCSAYAGMACMIVSRTHYTIDVVIAHWLTTLIFASYHAYAESDLFMDRRQSVLHRYAYFKVVAWLEENIVPGRLDNVFVNPWEEFRDRFRNEQRRDVGNGHHKQVSVSSSSTFAMPSA